MNRIVFLDRDGVINRERGEYTWKKEDFIILPRVADFIAEMKKRNFLVVVITNQGGIGKGLYTHEDYLQTEKWMHEALGEAGRPDEIYYCPHHTDTSRCICRKPDSALIEKALARFNACAEESFFIGDKERDMEAARKCGVHGVWIEANSPIFSIIDKIQQ